MRTCHIVCASVCDDPALSTPPEALLCEAAIALELAGKILEAIRVAKMARHETLSSRLLARLAAWPNPH